MYSLTEFQLSILQVLWEHEEATVTEVVSALERSSAPSTVATISVGHPSTLKCARSTSSSPALTLIGTKCSLMARAML